jgi:hypothetical protein
MKKTILAFGVGFLVAAWAIGNLPAAEKVNPSTDVGITRIVIAERHPAFGGASFGSAGPYEVLSGTANSIRKPP